MFFLNAAVIIVIGLGFVALLAHFTSWPFAFLCFGLLFAGATAGQSASMRPLEKPLAYSTARGKAILAVTTFVSLVVPFAVGVIWFSWWWGVVGLILGGLGAGLAGAFVPFGLRVPLGLLIAAGSAMALVL